MREMLFFGDFVRLYVLCQLAKRPAGTKEIVVQLNHLGYRLDSRSVYHLLRAMERLGCLTGRFLIAPDTRRKFYEVTHKGRQVMQVAKLHLGELARKLS